jgi:prepilin-type N-terminal cleavage/methylation domain-containing protein
VIHHDADCRRHLAPASDWPRWIAPLRAYRRCTKRAGLTLIEVLISIAILGILAAILIPQLTSDVPERLDAVAWIVAADLDYARGLAVANNSNYQFVLETSSNCYYLYHSGDNNLLDALPDSPFRQNNDPPDRQTTNLATLPIPEPRVRLLGAVQLSGLGQPTTTIEFKPSGETTSSVDSMVWLACGSGDNERFISVTVNWVTGLTTIGPLLVELPTGSATALGLN